ncbi:7165_t:CDS:2 [Ambispora leptoticha]|uniref:Carboxypeptidase n=1 Tax=Ambispora leptoticha TaxID=144679 RepID=A0A9N9BQ79_9GLOM|nr:7165_t:CDS:2 [Ambispora leptoticha]
MTLQRDNFGSFFFIVVLVLVGGILLSCKVHAEFFDEEFTVFGFDEKSSSDRVRLAETTSEVQVTLENNNEKVAENIDDIKNFQQGFDEIKHGLEDIWDSIGDVFNHEIDNVKDYLKPKKGNKNKSWAKILTHDDFPDYDIKMKEPKLCDSSVKQYSGYLDASSNKHFFFWIFESRNNPKTDPITLWLNGGPGCSSLTGLFFELGPCTVNDDGSDTFINPYSWNSNSTVIFLDQPTNVGYSHGNSVSNTLAAAKDVYAFLQIFFKEFPDYANLEFHIAGESYAGHYIPAIAAEINKNNEGTSAWIQSFKPKHLKHINLESILIGNGLVDSLVQYKYYPEMACNSTYEPVLDEATCDRMRKAYPTCARLINNCYKSQNVFNCLPASMYCNKELIQPYQATGKNPYDVRKKCEGNNLCYPILGSIETYLNKKEIMEELGAEVDEYKSCNMEVNFRFQMAGDWMRPFHLSIPPLLANNIRVLVYAGDADFICNWLDGFNKAINKDWIIEDGSESIAGKVRSYKGLTFLQIFEAGHMTPYDQPVPSLDFFNRWIQKREL